MPYIKEELKDRCYGLYTVAENPGVLNYMLTSVIIAYLESKGLKYSTCNDIVGALECCKQEFIRRIVNPYEDLKIKENGDVYPTLEELLK